MNFLLLCCQHARGAVFVASERPTDNNRTAMSSRMNLLAAIAIALVIRLLISWFSYGTNDVATWQEFGNAIRANGLTDSYRNLPKLNHPPIPAYWAALATWITVSNDAWFPFVFRIPAILADVASCVILALIWQKRAG
jgi:hypothetical protein